MKREYKNLMVFGGILLIIVLLFYFSSNQIKLPQFKYVCTKYAWQEKVCSSYTTVCDTCWQTCTRTITDCNKCGEFAKDFDSGLNCPDVDWQSNDKCRIYCKDKGYTSGRCTSFRAGSSSYSSYSNVYYCTCTKWVCETCEEKYSCNPYLCNCRQECQSYNYVTKTGSSCPSGAINCQCVEGFESCGNGVCESQYGEDVNSCAVDCKPKPVCGNGICETQLGENANTCPSDCITSPPRPPTPSFLDWLKGVFEKIWNWLTGIFGFQIIQSKPTKQYIVNEVATITISIGGEIANIPLNRDYTKGTYDRLYGAWVIMDENKNIIKYEDWSEIGDDRKYEKIINFTTDKPGKYYVVAVIGKITQTWQNGQWVTGSMQEVYKEADTLTFIIPRPPPPPPPPFVEWIKNILLSIWNWILSLFGGK
jgi:hypothetical protein